MLSVQHTRADPCEQVRRHVLELSLLPAHTVAHSNPTQSSFAFAITSHPLSASVKVGVV